MPWDMVRGKAVSSKQLSKLERSVKLSRRRFHLGTGSGLRCQRN